jgi:hypothetical protein
MRKPPGYDELDKLSKLPSDAEAWAHFTRKTLKIEGYIVSAVQEVVRQRGWRSSQNPIGHVKTAAIREALKMGLHEDEYAGSRGRSVKCPCGLMRKTDAEQSGHVCGVPMSLGAIKLPVAALSDDWGDSGARNNGGAANGPHDSAVDILTFRNCDYSDDGRIEYDGIQYKIDERLKHLAPDLLTFDAGAGTVRLNWVAIGRKAGLSAAVARVMELRYGYRMSRTQVLEYATTDRQRREFRSAWLEITQSEERIREVLKPTLFGWCRPVRVAPVSRRVSLLNPLDEGKLADTLAERDARFGYSFGDDGGRKFERDYKNWQRRKGRKVK